MSAFNALTTRHWAIEPDALKLMAKIALRKNETPEALSTRLGMPLKNTRTVTVIDNNAIVPVTGPLFPKATMLDAMCGAVSLEILMQDIQSALDNPQINAIVLDMDSPGGVAFGPSEMAAFVAKAKAQKPIIAYVGGLACSAAYWIASAATEIVAEKSAMLGSIGVVTAVPVQEAPDQDGNKYIEIVSSNAKNKRPDPMTEGGMKEITRELDALEELFIQDVAQYRGVSVQTVKEKFGAGGILIAADAVRVGMADKIGSFESVLQSLSNRFHPNNIGGHMANNEKVPAAEKSVAGNATITVQTLMSDFPDIAASLTKEGFAAGAAAERERILAIEDVAMAGHEALVAAAKKDGKTTADQLAGQILKAEKQRGANWKSDVKSEIEKMPAIDPSGANAPAKALEEDKTLPVETRAKAKWDASADLRTEYADDFKAYVGFMKAEESGRCRITSRAKN